MRKPAIVLLWMAALLPAGAMALGLGGIKLNSALNQPLDAEIELVSAAPGELDSLQISLASGEAFASYGLDRPAFLNDMRFVVVPDGRGGATVRVTTTQPVKEPFVTFLVEADWARGRLLREYTVLLDPPVFMPEPASQAPTEARPPVETVTRPETGAVTRVPAAPATAPATEPAPDRTAPIRAEPAGGAMSLRYGPIRRAETLWTIAGRLRPEASITINQMMIALYRENPQAFMGNINRLRQGAVLRVPNTRDIYALSSAEAFAEVRRQNAAWRGARAAAAGRGDAESAAGTQAGTAASSRPAGGRLRLVPPGDAERESGTSAAETAPTDADVAANAALSQRIRGLEEELQNARRLIDVKDSELSALQARLEALEAQLAEQEAAAAGEAEAAAGPETVVDTGVAEEAGAVGEAGETAVPERTPERPVTRTEPEPERATPAVTRPQVAAPAEEAPGLFSRIFGFLAGAWLWILGLIVAAAAAVAAVLFLRKRASDEDYEDTWETGEWKAPEPPPAAPAPVAEPDTASQPAPKFERDDSIVVVEAEDTITEETLKPAADDFTAAIGDAFEDTGTFTPGELEVEKPELEDTFGDEGTADFPFEDTMIGHDALKLDESDPMAEADFHMAYGLYDQAASLVENAVAREPGRTDLKMKLMEIFFVWGNKDRFLEEARAFKDSDAGSSVGDWEKIAIMGNQLCPGEELFTDFDATGALAEPDLALSFEDDESSATATDLDVLGDGDDAGDMLSFDLGDEGGDDLEALQEKIESQLEPSEETMDLGSTHLDLDLDAEAEDVEGLEQTDVSKALPESDDDADTGVRAAAVSDELDEDMDIDLDFQFDEVSDEEPTAVLGDAEQEEIDAAIAAADDDATRLAAGIGADELEDEEATRIADLLGEDEDSDKTVLAEGSDFDVFAEDDKTVAAPRFADDEDDDEGTQKIRAADFSDEDDEGGTMQMPSVDLDDDESEHRTEVMPALSEDDFADEGTRRLEKPDFAYGGDETVQISADRGESGDGDRTVQVSSGDFESDATQRTQVPEGANGEDFDHDDDDEESTQKLQTLDLPETDDMDEVGTKLDLARAFVDMGDPDGARNILYEVLDEGNDTQKQEAQNLLDRLG